MKININPCIVKGEMISGGGEDSLICCFCESKGIIGVFDGCGGLGARRYAEFENRTGADIGAAKAASSTLDWYDSLKLIENKTNNFKLSDNLKRILRENFALLKKQSQIKNVSILKGSLNNKSFPTTLCCILFNFSNIIKENVECIYLWAGDSRGYILDCNGLWQITKDDTTADVDGFVHDAKLENVINADTDFYINERNIFYKSKSLFIVSTDGGCTCFHTPMEFEYTILKSLIFSDSITEWQQKLSDDIIEIASDDYTVIIYSLGFENFAELKSYYMERLKYLSIQFIYPIEEGRENGKEIDYKSLWDEYVITYDRQDLLL